MRSLRRETAGQAAVETAIVFPLFLFMILGILQMALVFQARSMLKYAAYRAARAGAMHHACNNKMKEAALSALVPVIAWGDSYLRAGNTGQYLGSLMQVKMLNRYPTGLPIVDVRICNPLREDMSGAFRIGQEVDFDDPQNTTVTGTGATAMRSFERTKLRIQVKYYQHLVIPLANSVIFRSWTGQRMADAMRMNDQGFSFKNSNRVLDFDEGGKSEHRAEAENEDRRLSLLAELGHYYMPMYANYVFRMQSNFYLNECPLPQKNECWHYKASSAR